MNDVRWRTVRPWRFSDEAVVTDRIRQDLQDLRGWANFGFVATTGHPLSVDLLVLTPSGLRLVEFFTSAGELHNQDQLWLLASAADRTASDSPLRLAGVKADQLSAVLSEVAGPVTVQAAVLLTDRHLRVALDPAQRAGIFRLSPGGDLPDLSGDLLTGRGPDIPPAEAARLADAVEQVLTATGSTAAALAPAGTWALTQPALDSSADWQDHLAWSTELDKVHRRVRLYPVPPGATAAERHRVEQGAAREFQELRSGGHPGLVRAETLEHHPIGPAVVFHRDLRTRRLDQILALHGAGLDQPARIELVRQLAEALAFAHGRHLHHGRLDLRAVLATPRPSAADPAGWTSPRLEISDWHTASRRPRTGGEGDTARLRAADLAALGGIARHLLVGDGPALSAGPALRRFVEPAQAPSLTTADALLELLDPVEDETRSGPSAVPPGGLLEARRGDHVDGWRIERRVTTRPDGRLLLASDGAHRMLLKVPLSRSDPGAVEREDQRLRRFDDPRVERPAGTGAALLAGEPVLLLRAAGRQSLGRWLIETGRPGVADLFRLGRQVLDIVALLEAAGVQHGDLTPANLAVSADGLTLVGFAAGVEDAERLQRGAPQYRDPFLGGSGRVEYDAAADRYSAALVLHELCGGALPVWGDGFTDPTRTTGPATLDLSGADPVLHDGLAAFFARGLARNVADRFHDIVEMSGAWQSTFAVAAWGLPLKGGIGRR